MPASRERDSPARLYHAAFEVADYWFKAAAADKQNAQTWGRAGEGFAAALKLDPKSARTAAKFCRRCYGKKA